jgi:hypothetical protein
MGDQKKGGLLKWILMGCGCISILAVAGFGGCAALVWFAAGKAMEAPSAAGEAYLRAQPDITTELGQLSKVEWTVLGSRIHVQNTTGAGMIHYRLTGSKASGEGTVWMTYANSTWTATGCEVTAGGKQLKIGETVVVPETHSSD